MSSITPTIGRKVWFWSRTSSGLIGCRDEAQAFDGTVTFVYHDGSVDVAVRTHSGTQAVMNGVEMWNPGERFNAPDRHGHGLGDYCTWMPYQVAQAQKE